MVVPDTMDAAGLVRKHFEADGGGDLAGMIKVFAYALMPAEADALCAVAYGEVSPGRVNVRNGYRDRDFDTRAGTISLAIPKLRHGSYFPTGWLNRAVGPSGRSPRR